MRAFADAIRRADWLDAKRVRAYAALGAIACAALLVNSFVKAMMPEGTDFLAFWGSARSVLAGAPATAYDLGVQEAIQTGTGAQAFFAFVNPPPFLFVTTPFGLLELPFAWVAWVAVTYAVWAFVACRAFPRLWPIVLVWPGALLAAGHAQNGFVTGALLVVGATLVDRRPLLAGAAIGALVIKPHLALLMPFWLAAGGHWRAFVAAGVSAVGLLALSWAVFGTETMLAYTDSWQASAQLMSGHNPDFYLRMSTLYSQVRIFAGHEVALAVQGMLTLALIGLVWLSWRRFDGDPQASGAFALAATALASPYLFNYDLPFLIVPTLWLVREGLARGFRDYEKLGLVLLWMAPYATRAVALPLGINLMPLASIALACLVWTRASRNGPA